MILAWQKAGATVGWISRYEYHHMLFHTNSEERKAGELPALVMARWHPGVLKDLPAPPVPFALSLRGTSVGDSDLKELAGLQRLQVLDLSTTQVSPSGLRELANLGNLQLLNFSEMFITDTELKELAALQRAAVTDPLAFTGDRRGTEGIGQAHRASIARSLPVWRDGRGLEGTGWTSEASDSQAQFYACEWRWSRRTRRTRQPSVAGALEHAD